MKLDGKDILRWKCHFGYLYQLQFSDIFHNRYHNYLSQIQIFSFDLSSKLRRHFTREKKKNSIYGDFSDCRIGWEMWRRKNEIPIWGGNLLVFEIFDIKQWKLQFQFIENEAETTADETRKVFAFTRMTTVTSIELLIDNFSFIFVHVI